MLVEKEPRRGEIIMTPSETGGCEEVLLFRAPQAAIQFFVCVATYGALLHYKHFLPWVLPRVIVVSLP
jgi:hypothetical protein